MGFGISLKDPGAADLRGRAVGQSEEPWYFWEEEYDMRGAIGHGGGNWGTMAGMYFVEDQEGGYGIILMTNTRCTAKYDEVWLLTVYQRIQAVLIQEAYERFTKAQVS